MKLYRLIPCIIILIGCNNQKKGTVDYVIENDTHKQNIKRMVDVRLSKKIDLKNIENIWKSIYENDYDRTFKIKGDSSSLSWAVSEFNPEYKAEIIGTTSKQDSLMYHNLKYNTIGSLISAWKGNNDMLGSIYAISKTDTEILFSQFSYGELISTDTIVFNGNKFDMNDGEYAMIYKDGSMGFYAVEDDGKFAHLKFIKHVDSIQ